MGPENRNNDQLGDVPAMKDESQNSNNFLFWAKRVSSEHPDILDHMLKSQDVLDKVIAKRILAVAGGEDD